MDFKNSIGIYQQIGESICEKILSGQLPVGEKLPSVREQAANLGVNQNTIMRTYTELQREEIISNKRGIGYFVTDEAPKKIMEQRRNAFFADVLPEFIRQVEILQLTKQDLSALFDRVKE